MRLFGVTGLDIAGRPLAGATIDRWLAGDPHRLGSGIALPFAMVLSPSTTSSHKQLALDIASGAIDLAFEVERSCESATGGRSRGSRRRASPPPQSSASTPSGRSAARPWRCSGTPSDRGPG